MEEYEDVGGNALIAYERSDATDATDATAATTGGQRDGVDGQNLQVARQLMLEMEKNQLGTPGILRATSGNAAKRLKMRQEMRATTRAGKSAEAAIIYAYVRCLEALALGQKTCALEKTILHFEQFGIGHENEVGQVNT